MADPVTVERAKAALIESADRLDPFRRGCERAAGLTRHRPIAAWGAAFGIGLVLGRSPALRRAATRALGVYARSKLPSR